MRGSVWLSSQSLNTWGSSPHAHLAPEEPLWKQGSVPPAAVAGSHFTARSGECVPTVSSLAPGVWAVALAEEICSVLRHRGREQGEAEQCRQSLLPVDKFLYPPRAAGLSCLLRQAWPVPFSFEPPAL